MKALGGEVEDLAGKLCATMCTSLKYLVGRESEVKFAGMHAQGCSWSMGTGREEDLISACRAKDKGPPSRAWRDIVYCQLCAWRCAPATLGHPLK